MFYGNVKSATHVFDSNKQKYRNLEVLFDPSGSVCKLMLFWLKKNWICAKIWVQKGQDKVWFIVSFYDKISLL